MKKKDRVETNPCKSNFPTQKKSRVQFAKFTV